MANIREYLAQILSARYGKDVRQSIHDSIEEINNVNEANISTVQAIANTAQGYADNAEDSKDLAEQAVTDAQAQVTLANTARTGAETAEDGAEHFYQETLAIAQALGSALIPRGTVEFANLPSVSSTAVKDGYMWNISDSFTTTSDFVEGAGLSIPMGANVYKVTINNVPKWDILAGSSAQVYTGTEAQIEQAIQQGLLGEGVMINSLDDGDDDLLTTSMISHDGDSLENKLDDIDDSISQLNSDLALKLPQGDIQSLGYIRVNQATGTSSNGEIVGTWYKVKSSQSGRLVYIDYMINYNNQTPSNSDTIRLDGFPQTTFVGWNGTVLKTTQTGLTFNASGNSFSSSSNHTSDNLMLVALAGNLAQSGCGHFKGFLW